MAVLIACTVLFSGCAQAPRDGMFSAALEGEPVTATFGMRAADDYTGNWKDMYVRSTKPTLAYPSTTASLLQNGVFNIHYIIGLSALPDDAVIESAKLHIYVDSYDSEYGSMPLEVRSLSEAKQINATADTWNKADKDSGINWTNNDGGFSDASAAYGSTWEEQGTYGARELEFNSAGITYLQSKVAAGVAQLMLYASAEGQDCGAGNCIRYIRMSEEANDARKPYLEVTYSTGGGGGTQYCTDGTEYGQCSATKPKKCVNGSPVDVCSECGCNAGFTCDANGSCMTQAECNNGETRQCGSTDTGACEYGTQTCSNGSWGTCIGAVGPGTETCGNGIDEDCDGTDMQCGAVGTVYVCGSGSECNAGAGSGWGTGNDSYACTSKAQPCLTIQGGLAKMSSGDTLIIGDGTYTNYKNQVLNSKVKNGSPFAYTKIAAENPFHVTLDGGFTSDYAEMLDLGGNSYVHIDGIFFFRGQAIVKYSNHIKITRCAFAESSDGSGVKYNLSVGGGSTYILVEDCFTFGAGRYKFGISSTGTTEADRVGANNHIIFRRCVGRFDYHYQNYEMIATFANYWQTDNAFQNCISLDGLSYNPMGGSGWGNTKSFMCPNCSPISRLKIEGSIALNDKTHAMFFEGKPGAMHVKDSVIWGISPRDGFTVGSLLYVGYDMGANIFENMTIGGSTVDRGAYHKDGNGTSKIKDSIFYGLQKVTSSYPANKHFYAEYCDFSNNAYDGKTGENSMSIDPVASGSLKYLAMIEQGSPLYNAGSDGGPVGATILKKIGVSGSLMGEAGWDTLTNENLWPWPYEDEIKRLMCDEQYNLHADGGVDFNRGFCLGVADKYGGPRTLTSYIWEYLGNPTPAWIYGTGTPPCAQGEITGACICGGQEYEDGYCCSGSWQATDCIEQCGEGLITGDCYCGGAEYGAGDGYCCLGAQQEEECGQKCTPACTQASDCSAFQCCKNAGSCEAECVVSMNGLMSYINKWKTGELTLVEIIEKVANWKRNGSSCI